MECHYCHEEMPVPDLRPYGPGGAMVCHPCATATPEREAATAAAFGRETQTMAAELLALRAEREDWKRREEAAEEARPKMVEDVASIIRRHLDDKGAHIVFDGEAVVGGEVREVVAVYDVSAAEAERDGFALVWLRPVALAEATEGEAAGDG